MSDRMDAQNAEYPADYGEYLEACFDPQIGRPMKSYEDWTNGKRECARRLMADPTAEKMSTIIGRVTLAERAVLERIVERDSYPSLSSLIRAIVIDVVHEEGQRT